MPADAILSLTKDFSLPVYIDAFGGDEELAFKKAVQSLMNGADHESLDLAGRRVSITEPLDLQAAVPNRLSYAQRRVIRNGQLRAEGTTAWDKEVVTSAATYSASKSGKADAGEQCRQHSGRQPCRRGQASGARSMCGPSTSRRRK